MVTGAHSTVLDVFCVDSKGTLYDMEVQTGGDLEPKRFRYYASAMDMDYLMEGTHYSELPSRWLIVVLEKGPDGPGRAVRTYRSTEEGDRTELGDGTCFIYVNAAYRGEGALGLLMADFCQSDPDKIRNKLLRKRVHYLKRDEKGMMEMLNVSEEIYNEGREEGAQDNLLNKVRSLMETVGWTAQEALERLKVPKADQPRYIAML